MTEMNRMYDGLIRRTVDSPEHLEIQKLSQQIRDRVDKLEWMLSQTVMTVERRDELEEAWRNLKRAEAVPTNTSAKDSSPPTPSTLTPNS